MRLAFPVSIALSLAPAACSNDDTSGWETFDGDGDDTTETGTESEESTGTESDDTSTDTETETDTGDTGPYEGTRYLVTGTDDALLLGIDLDDPLAVPEPEEIITGAGATGLFGPTPFGTEMLSHKGRIDQVRLTETGDYEFTPLLPQPANWLDHIFFGTDAVNAIASVGPESFGVGNQLVWLEYDSEGQVVDSNDITPPIDANGAVLVLARSPNTRYAAVLVDVELDSIWELYLLNLDPSPNVATYIDVVDLAGLPPTSVGDFLWLHLDDQRIVYRKEGLPGVFRPLAVALDDVDVNRVNLTPTLGHISSLVWSPDGTRVLVSTEGGDGYRELWLVELDGPTDAAPPLLISEPGADGLVNTVDFDFATLGHGFDDFGRIWYAYTDSNLAEPASVGINLVVVVNGDIAQRSDLTATGPGLEVGDVMFDAKLQVLGYRAQTAGTSAIHWIDMSEAPPVSVQIDQDFVYSAGVPQDDANFALAADGSRIAVLGVQGEMTTLHISDLDDPTGSTTEITLPDVEAAGIDIDHIPRINADGEQVIVWYRAQDGRTGLIHAPADGSGEGQVVLGLDLPLRDGTFLQYLAE